MFADSEYEETQHQNKKIGIRQMNGNAGPFLHINKCGLLIFMFCQPKNEGT